MARLNQTQGPLQGLPRQLYKHKFQRSSSVALPRCVRHDSQEEVGLLLEFVARSRSHEVLHPIHCGFDEDFGDALHFVDNPNIAKFLHHGLVCTLSPIWAEHHYMWLHKPAVWIWLSCSSMVAH